MPEGAAAVTLSPDEFASAFPFHFAFGRDMVVQQHGRSLPRACPDLGVGASVAACLTSKHPPIALEFEAIRAHGGGLFILVTPTGVTLRGQMLHQPDGDRIVFIGSPWLSQPSDIGKAGLAINDFALHDPIIDLLQVMQSGYLALADSRRLAKELTRQRAELERLSLVASKTHNGVIMTDARGVTEWVNQGFERLTGYTAAEAIGRSPGSLLQGPATDADTVDRIRSHLSQGMSFTEEILNYRKDGSQFWNSLDVTPIVREDGRVERFIAIESDITARRQAQDALARVTTLMTTLIENLQAGVLFEDQGRRVMLANPGFCEMFHLACGAVGLRGSPWEDIAGTVASRFRDGDLFLRGVEEIRDRRAVKSGEELELGDGRVLERDAIPILVDGDWQGYLWVYRDVTWRRLEERALRAARQREAEIGSRIQEALLFGKPPQHFPGLEVEAFSLPSETIAGDFYDFFRQGPRCLDVLVGDVMGKGIPAALLAAAIKSQFLQAVAHLVLDSGGVPPEPEQVVQRVHEVLTPQLIALESFATLMYARFNLHEGIMTWVDCGHERTLLMRSGATQCETLEGVNVPLGFSEREIYRQVTVSLGAGDRLLFYSDGVTEARGGEGEFFGRERLERILEEHRACEPQLFLSRVFGALQDFTHSSTFTDDLTCIALTVGGADMDTGHEACLVLPADLGQLGRVRDFVHHLCTCVPSNPVGEEAIEHLQVAVGEAVTNIIRHAYRGRAGEEVEISGRVDADRVVVTLHDRGEPFCPGPVEEPDLLAERDGGMGLYLMEQAVDRVAYSRDPDGRNCVSLEVLRPSPPPLPLPP